MYHSSTLLKVLDTTFDHLDEALVEGEIVPDWVLPALSVDGVVGEGRHDPGVDLRQRHPPGGRGLDGHRDERDVGVRGLLRGVRCQAERAAQEVIADVEHVHLWWHVLCQRLELF